MARFRYWAARVGAIAFFVVALVVKLKLLTLLLVLLETVLALLR